MERREMLADGLRYLARLLPAMVGNRRKSGNLAPSAGWSR